MSKINMEIIFEHNYKSAAVKVRVNKIIEDFQQSRNKNIDLPTFVSFIRTETPHGIIWYTSNKIEIREQFDNLELLNYLTNQWNLLEAAEESQSLPLGLYDKDSHSCNAFFPFYSLINVPNHA